MAVAEKRAPAASVKESSGPHGDTLVRCKEDGVDTIQCSGLPKGWVGPMYLKEAQLLEEKGKVEIIGRSEYGQRQDKLARGKTITTKSFGT